MPSPFITWERNELQCLVEVIQLYRVAERLTLKPTSVYGVTPLYVNTLLSSTANRVERHYGRYMCGQNRDKILRRS